MRDKLAILNGMARVFLNLVVHIVDHEQINQRIGGIKLCQFRKNLFQNRRIKPVVRVDNVEILAFGKLQSMVDNAAPVTVLLVNGHNNVRVFLLIGASNLKRVVFGAVVDDKNLQCAARIDQGIQALMQERTSIVSRHGKREEFAIGHISSFRSVIGPPSAQHALGRRHPY